MERQRHTVRSYEGELRLLADRVAEMVQVCEGQLVQAVTALAERDARLAEAVIRNDEQVDVIQHMVDEQTVRMLAKRQPMAYDLRIVIASQRMAADLERVADYAANIAKNALQLDGIEADLPIAKIQEMADHALEMLRTVRGAYERCDLEAAAAVRQADERINTLFGDMIGLLRELMARNPDNVRAGTILLFAARCCERIGDHIKNVAEQVHYMVTGFSPPQER